jgi:hypothetical protein
MVRSQKTHAMIKHRVSSSFLWRFRNECPEIWDPEKNRSTRFTTNLKARENTVPLKLLDSHGNDQLRSKMSVDLNPSAYVFVNIGYQWISSFQHPCLRLLQYPLTISKVHILWFVISRPPTRTWTLLLPFSSPPLLQPRQLQLQQPRQPAVDFSQRFAPRVVTAGKVRTGQKGN